jgi:hypothetical protein
MFLYFVFAPAVSLADCGSGKSALIGSWLSESGDHAPGVYDYKTIPARPIANTGTSIG